MNEDMLQLRRGERLNPAEVDDAAVEGMHERLDAIAGEPDGPMVPGPETGLPIPELPPQRRSWREVVDRVLEVTTHVLAGVAVGVLLGLWVGTGMGWLS